MANDQEISQLVEKFYINASKIETSYEIYKEKSVLFEDNTWTKMAVNELTDFIERVICQEYNLIRSRPDIEDHIERLNRKKYSLMMTLIRSQIVV
jgi:hypothetical protein